MKRKIIVTLLVCLIGLVGCENSTKEQETNQKLESTTETVVGEETKNDKETEDDEFSNISVSITNKINHEADINAGVYNPFVELPYSITNNTNKEIKGIQGILHVQDMFGEKITDIQFDLTSQNVPIGQTVKVDEYGIKINEFMDDHTKLYDTSYENLQFVYEFSKVVFSDGTSIQ